MKRNKKENLFEEEKIKEVMSKYEGKFSDIARVIEETGSLITASEQLNIPYSELKIIERFNKEVSNAVFYATCKNLDKVERKLIDSALEGNLDAIKFYLETVGRGRFHKTEEKLYNIRGNVGDALEDFFNRG